MTATTSDPSLPKLLAALAVGARSVNNLPVSGNNKDDDDIEETDSENEEELDDEFNYQMAFPEFSSLCLESRTNLSSMLNRALKSSTGQLDQEGMMIDDEDMFEFDDPRLWESAAEVCDVLLERVDLYIQNVKEGRAGLDLEQVDSMRQFGTMARNKAKGDYDRLIGSLVDMNKPQVTYGFADDIENSRTEPFLPNLNAQSACSLEQVPGHGLNSRRYGGTIPDDIIAPSLHYAHPYKETIETFEYINYQFKTAESGIHGRSGTLQNTSLATEKGIWIDTENDLAKLASRIENDENNVHEIAIDLEAHSFRTFSGFVCTMQLSLPRPSVPEGSTTSAKNEDIETGYDFIIDTLALRNVVNKYFATIFANPNIVKVMHGADSDVQWLQRDFGIYVCNLFDTGRACRILPDFTSAGLAYLLRKYAKIEADKKHQLSDWRQRPIPNEMLQYAISDTMYLLDIYEKIKSELKQHESDEISIKSVLDESRKVCLNRYDKEPFNPGSYKLLMTSKRGKRKGAILSSHQENILKAMYNWRDATAREEDESLQYVCANTGLLRIAATAPRNVSSLQACVNPLPPLVLKYGGKILRLVQDCLIGNNNNDQSLANELAHPNKHSNDQEESHKAIRGGMMSPVLGTEELYKQARWMTPQVESSTIACLENSSTSSEDVTNDIVMHSSNSNFKTNSYTSHSLEMRNGKKGTESRRGQSVDGLGAARVILNQINDDSSKKENNAEVQKKIAQKCAGRIRSTMMSGNQNLLGLVKATSFVNEGEDDDEGNEINIEDDIEENIEENEIPKSMKEIYRISNRNRRRSKKTPVMFENGEEPNAEKVEADLKAAEAILARSGPNGTGYFDGDISSKRQRTKSQDTDNNDSSSPATNSNDLASKEEDIALMTSLGWVKDKEEAESLFDYSNATGLEIYDPNAPVSNNPFFSGAAVSGGTLQHSSGKSDRRKGPGRKGRKNNSTGGGSKTKAKSKSKSGQK